MLDITHTDISAGFKTEHSMVTIKLALHSNPWGPGFWKLNRSSLSEIKYVNQMRTEIEGITNENQKEKSVDSSFLWKMIKLKIRDKVRGMRKQKRLRCR